MLIAFVLDFSDVKTLMLAKFKVTKIRDNEWGGGRLQMNVKFTLTN